MSKLNSFLQKTSSVKNICISFLASHLVLLLMMVYTFPVINHQIGTSAFDLQPLGYSLSLAESIVSSLDDDSRALYLFPQLTVLDLLYPFLLATFLGSLLFRLRKLTETKSRIASAFLVIPFAAMICDYSENMFVILMITESIELSEFIVFLSSTCTLLKGLLTSLAWMGILFYSVKWFARKSRIPLQKSP